MLLNNKPLITAAMEGFRKTIGAKLNKEQADTLALALERP